jgi:hypothetical protein
MVIWEEALSQIHDLYDNLKGESFTIARFLSVNLGVGTVKMHDMYDYLGQGTVKMHDFKYLVSLSVRRNVKCPVLVCLLGMHST